eukprot:scaffold135107_cov49-Attheya_sp.AAC.3
MLCCDPFSCGGAYAPVSTDESKKDPLLSSPTKHERGINLFPGERRALDAMYVPDDQHDPPSGITLMKTRGNALAAFDPNNVEDSEVVEVTVPPGVKTGETIHVTAPDSSNRVVAAIVPEGMTSGSTFLVKFPPSNPLIMTGVPVDKLGDLYLTQDNFHDSQAVGGKDTMGPIQPNQDEYTVSSSVNVIPQKCENGHPFIKVKVPKGLSPGSTFRVQLPGKEKFYADLVVPEGNASELMVDPKQMISPPVKRSNKQNWHDNPVAYGAPMIVGPFL